MLQTDTAHHAAASVLRHEDPEFVARGWQQNHFTLLVMNRVREHKRVLDCELPATIRSGWVLAGGGRHLSVLTILGHVCYLSLSPPRFLTKVARCANSKG